MSKIEGASKFYIGLIKPCKEVIFSPEYERNVSVHGPFQLYTDLLEVDTESVILVLAALRDKNIVKLSPVKNQKGNLGNSMTLLSQESDEDETVQQQLKITIDGNFVQRFLARSKLDKKTFKFDFEALDMRRVMCCYFSIDEMNTIKVKSLMKRVAASKKEDFEIEFPGEKIDFLKNYEVEKKKKEEKKPVDHKFFYDLEGHKHMVHERTKKKLKEDKKMSRWWNRLSEPKVRSADLVEQDLTPEENSTESPSVEIEQIDN